LSQRKLVMRSSVQAAFDQFFSFVASERTSHARRLRFASLLCILIVGLLYRTQWIVLRPGLTILLGGQAGVAIASFFRNQQLRKTLHQQEIWPAEQDSISAWFEGEESFVRRLALFETICQMAGFAVLGYELWIASGSLPVAVAIGIVYPAAMYFGMARKRNSTWTRQLMTKKQQIATMFHDGK
jgi:hypothetical protein